MEARKLVLHFDGSCKVNPGGPGGWGFVVTDGVTGERVGCGKGYMPEGPETTVNTAEWRGLLEGVRWLHASGLVIDSLRVFGDSQLVIFQARGKWKTKKPHLRRYKNKLKKVLRRMELGQVTFQWVPRHLNTTADALSTASYH